MSTVFGSSVDDASTEPFGKVAVCISASSDLAFAAAVTFINFIEIHGVEGFHFRLYSDSKLPRMVKIFKNLGAEFEVEIYRPPVNWTKLWGSRAIAYFSPLVLAKFEGFRLLSVFPTVVWLDYDIIIQKPLTELWTKVNFDLAYSGSSQPISNGFTVPPVGLDPEREGMSAGVMVFRSTFVGKRTATLDLYGLFLKEYSSLYYPEQAIFDLYLSHQKYVHWKLDDRFSTIPGSESPSTLIVHGFGSKKFWSGLQNDSWSSNYEEWLTLGGWAWNPMRAKLAKLIRALKYSIARLLMLFSVFSSTKS
jgi:hypothetical protein